MQNMGFAKFKLSIVIINILFGGFSLQVIQAFLLEFRAAGVLHYMGWFFMKLKPFVGLLVSGTNTHIRTDQVHDPVCAATDGGPLNESYISFWYLTAK